jgi:hypothetical protein
MQDSTKLEVEGGELLIKSSKGIMAVIPKDRVDYVKDLIERKNFAAVDKYVQGLAVLKQKDKAEEGGVIQDPPVKAMAPAESTGSIAGSLARVNFRIAERNAEKERLYQEALKDKTGAAEEAFVARYNTSPHRYKYDSDPEYRKQTDKNAAETSKVVGSIDLPATDVRSRNYAGNPNLAFMTQKGMSKEGRRALEGSNLEIIGAALPVPGVEAVGKIPSLAKLGGKLIQKQKSVGSTISKPDIVKYLHDGVLINELPKPSSSSKEYIVLQDFKKRLQTEEGQKRLEKLGINSAEFFKQLDLTHNVNEKGGGAYYDEANWITANPLNKNLQVTTRHEIEHAIQNAFQKSRQSMYGQSFDRFPHIDSHIRYPYQTKIDRSMSKLETWDEPMRANKYEEFEKKYRLGQASPEDVKNVDLNYFFHGSEGREKAPFLSELQQYLIDKKFIGHQYDQIKIDDIQKAYKEYITKGDDVRLFKIMKPSSYNFALLRDNLNAMLSATGVAGTGAAASQSIKQNEK